VSADVLADEEQPAQARPAAAQPNAGAVETPIPRSGTADGMNADAEALAEALWYAAADGDIDRFRRLLARGAEIDAKQTETVTTALWIASQEGHTEMVRLLLALGAEV